MTQNLSAVILGTRSGPRLTTPIPMLPFGESTVLTRTLASYLEAGFAQVIVVLGSQAEEIRASLSPLGDRVRVVETAGGDDRFAEMVRVGVEALSGGSQGIVLGLGDQPLLSSEILTSLSARFAESQAKVLVPTWHGHVGHPIWLRGTLAGELTRLGPDAESWEILQAHAKDLLDVEVPFTAVVRRIEDRADYYDLLRMAGLPVPESPAPEVAMEAAYSGNGGQPDPGRVASFGGDPDED